MLEPPWAVKLFVDWAFRNSRGQESSTLSGVFGLVSSTQVPFLDVFEAVVQELVVKLLVAFVDIGKMSVRHASRGHLGFMACHGTVSTV